jgi:hypothetical protein
MYLQQLTDDQHIKLKAIGFPYDGNISAALAIKWIRENKKIEPIIQPYYPGYPDDSKLQYHVSIIEHDPDVDGEDLADFNTYDKAESVALNHMIKRLLNITEK